MIRCRDCPSQTHESLAESWDSGWVQDALRGDWLCPSCLTPSPSQVRFDDRIPTYRRSIRRFQRMKDIEDESEEA